MERDLIFDLGMHDGGDTAFYLAKGFRVLAVDANARMVAAARRRFRSAIAARRLVVLERCIAASSGAQTFFVNHTNTEWSSAQREIGACGGRFAEVMVEGVTVADLLAEYGIPYYMKVDIEGDDDLALKALVTAPDRPRYVSVENGNGTLLDLMVRASYRWFKFLNQSTIPSYRLPHPSSEGRDIDYRFRTGCSGPFGDDTPGRWVGATEVRAHIDAYWNDPHRNPNIDGWYDLHGATSVTA